jgi:hypothetical protein
MENQKIIASEKQKGYIISVSEEYFYQTYSNWNNMTGNERMDIRNASINEIEAFLLGKISKGIVEMRYLDEHLNLRQAVTITPIENKTSF